MNSEKSTAEANRQSTAMERVHRIEMDPQALIQTALDKSAPVETLERLFELAKNVQAERARQAWYGAMAEFQRTCPAILKTKTADAGRYKFAYAPLSEIMDKIAPVMGPLGLSVSYRVKHDAQRIVAVCRVSHEMGHHEESGEVPIPIDSVTAGPSAAQRIGIASSYAKRYALLAITGIAPQDEDDQDGAADQAGIAMPRRASESTPSQEAPPTSEGQLSGKQISRLWAIAHASGKKHGKTENEVKSKVNALLGLNGATTVLELTRDGYESVCKALELWGNDAA